MATSYKQSDMALFFGIEQPELARLTRAGVLPMDSEGGYEPVKTTQSYISHLYDLIEGREIIDPEYEKNRALRAKADMLEVKARAEQERYHKLDPVQLAHGSEIAFQSDNGVVEKDKHKAAFLRYLTMEKPSMRAVGKEFGVKVATIHGWSRKFKWAERKAKYEKRKADFEQTGIIADEMDGGLDLRKHVGVMLTDANRRISSGGLFPVIETPNDYDKMARLYKFLQGEPDHMTGVQVGVVYRVMAETIIRFVPDEDKQKEVFIHIQRELENQSALGEGGGSDKR